MAGDPQIQGFRADQVRAGLRLAMQVGLPIAGADQPTFVFKQTVTGTQNLDAEGVPFNPSYTPTKSALVTKKVPCAIKYVDRETNLTGFGALAPTRVVLTLLDDDYAQVKGFQYVIIGGTRFFYRHTETPKGLVTVGLYEVHCEAEDEP